MGHQVFHDLLAHPHGGVQGDQGILEDNGALTSLVGPPLLFVVIQDVLAVVEYLTAGLYHAVGALHQAHHCFGGDGFAAAGFAHDGQRLALVQGEGHAAHGFDFTGIGVEGDTQVFNLKDMFLHIHFSFLDH